MLAVLLNDAERVSFLSFAPWTGQGNAKGVVVMKGERNVLCVQGIGTPISQTFKPFQQ
jgi:hypothetical protein